MIEISPLGPDPIREVQAEIAKMNRDGTDPVEAQQRVAARMAQLEQMKRGNDG